MTPDDELVRLGEPDLLPVPKVDEVHVSCVFTWLVERAKAIAGAWAARLPGVPVRVGGPAFGDCGICDGFTPGLYLKTGITITSRGCPNRCPWCYVPKREGALRLLPIREGHIIQDNNILACPEDHFREVCNMLIRQPKGARFLGGFEPQRLTWRHIKWLWDVRINEVWLAFDVFAPDRLDALHRAVARLKRLPALEKVQEPRRKLRCYVLIGRARQSIHEAELQLEAAWNAGCLPFAQLYRNDEGRVQASAEWRALARKWSRPAAMFAAHK
jgi:hypothetical protein